MKYNLWEDCPRIPITELLSFIVDNRGKTVPTVKRGWKLIATNCVTNRTLYPVYEKVRYLSEETYQTWFRAHPMPGDILFVNKGTPGRVCMVPDPVDFCIAQDMIALRADDAKIYNKYLFAVLRSNVIQQQIYNTNVGDVIPHFKKQFMDQLLIPVPRREIQEKIGDLYYDFSLKIEQNKRINDNLQKKKEKRMAEKIDIRGVPETMLQTLYARAKASQTEPHYIYDEKAIEIAAQLDYDFSAADKDYAMSSGVLARTIVLDRMVSEYLAGNPGAVVVNIACGLDTRCYRMEGYSHWYNLDLPETIAVRERFLRENGSVSQIAASAMDETWASMIEQTDEPVLVIIEGLTMYLSETDIKQIFAVIEKRFLHEVVFVETMSPFVVRHIKEKSIEGSQAKFTWGVHSGKELEQLLPDFRSIRDVSLVEGMQVFTPVYRILGKIGFIKSFSNKILVMER